MPAAVLLFSAAWFICAAILFGYSASARTALIRIPDDPWTTTSLKTLAIFINLNFVLSGACFAGVVLAAFKIYNHP